MVLFLRKAELGFFHFLEIEAGWLVPFGGQKNPGCFFGQVRKYNGKIQVCFTYGERNDRPVVMLYLTTFSGFSLSERQAICWFHFWCGQIYL
jgi:hypothetical protein